MKSTYQTGIDTNQINFGVTVGTIGTAFTAVYFVSNGEQSKIAESNEDSGNIPKKNIGNAIALRNNYLVIRTTIDLSNVDKTIWKNLLDNLLIRYNINGGFSGDKVFSQDIDDMVTSPDGKTIVVSKPIEFL